MPRLKLHLDADASRKALHRALVDRGHDVTRTPDDWIELDASDETQLLRASAHGRAIFTFNIRDFMALAEFHPQHRGIVLAAQSSWQFFDLVKSLDRFLSESNAEDVAGLVVWLRRWHRE